MAQDPGCAFQGKTDLTVPDRAVSLSTSSSSSLYRRQPPATKPIHTHTHTHTQQQQQQQQQ